MSSNKTSPNITSIIADGLTTFTYGTATTRATWVAPIGGKCYEWLKEAYPEIFKEFQAIQDIERGIDGI